MDYTIKINCDNAAFDDLAEELARILRREADRLTEWGAIPPDATLMDINGNKVGAATFEI